MKPLPKELKKKLQEQEEIRAIYKKIHPDGMIRTKFPEPKNRNVLILPEEFTGRDLKRAKKLMKGRKKK